MKRLLITSIALMVVLAVVGCSAKKEESGMAEKAKPEQMPAMQEGVAQTTCPVMGGKINKEVYLDYEGQRVYFCCKPCVGTFKKDPEKYMKMLEEQGVTLEKVSMMGEDMHDHEGHSHN